MNGNELIKRLKKHGIDFRIETKRGKGSHVTLCIGTRKTILKDRKKEISPGLLHSILKQIDLTRNDIN